MATQFTKDLFLSTYKDDFADSDNYHRILFNAGRSLQARELTQMQTITQRELSRLLKHVFKDGAPVNPGGVGVDNAYEFIKLDTTINTWPTDTTGLVGTTLTSTEGVEVQVLKGVAATVADPATLYVKYVSTQSGTAGATPVRAVPGTLLQGGAFTFTVQATNTTANPAVGRGTRVFVHAGDFYAKERIVFAAQQEIIIGKYVTNANAVVGFKVTEDIVTVADNANLYDNQGATLNRSAPGADRYRITLTLTAQDTLSASENFIYLAEIRDGAIVNQNVAGDDYNILDERLARRTYEESGDYIAKQFTLKFDTLASDTSVAVMDIGSGVAYVEGFRANVDRPVKIGTSKPRNVELLRDQPVGIAYGNYLVANYQTNKGLPTLFSQVTFMDSTNFGGNIIGTGYVSAIEENNDGNIRVHFINISILATKNRRDIVSFGTSATNYMNVVLEGSKAVFKDMTQTALLFTLPKDRPQSVTGADIDVSRGFVKQVDTNSRVTVTLTDASETVTQITDWTLSTASGTVFTNWSVYSGGAGQQTITFSTDLSSGTSVHIAGFVRKANATPRQKTLTTVTNTITPNADGSISLGKADIYDVSVVALGNSSGEDLSARYTLDNGQRDTHYDLGSLKLKPGQSVPGGDVYVSFRHFAHNANGSYFSVNSYQGEVDYAAIPSYTTRAGNTVNLRDVVDFRSVVNSSGTFGSGAIINYLPQNAGVVDADVNYYLSKMIRVMIDKSGAILTTESPQSLNPQLPPKLDGTLDLFQVYIRPYMLNNEDAVVRIMKAKRFTMKDIAQLENRVSKLEELTSLSLLEAKTESLMVFDSAGNSRFKSGIFVDNFADFSRSFTTSPDYNASIDLAENILRPSFTEYNTRLVIDTANSTGVTVKGDMVMLNYTSTPFLSQVDASEYVNVNPFAVAQNRGFIQLSPSSDDWVEKEYEAPAITTGAGRIVDKTTFSWNSWLQSWVGRANDIAIGETESKSYTSGDYTYTDTVRATSEQIVRENVKDNLLDIAFIAWMRSRRVYFRCYGFKPYTRVFAFFDGQEVNDWIKVEPFKYISQDDTQYGQLYGNNTSHPFGKTDILVTDGEGVIQGSFYIPSSRDGVSNGRRFRTGTREFRLMDVSVIDESVATNTAVAGFTSSGILETRQESWTAVREVTVTGSTSKVRYYPPQVYSSGGGDYWSGGTAGTTFGYNSGNGPNAYSPGGGFSTGPSGGFVGDYSADFT